MRSLILREDWKVGAGASRGVEEEEEEGVLYEELLFPFPPWPCTITTHYHQWVPTALLLLCERVPSSSSTHFFAQLWSGESNHAPDLIAVLCVHHHGGKYVGGGAARSWTSFASTQGLNQEW